MRRSGSPRARRRCDPGSPRRATATGGLTQQGDPEVEVAILGRPGGRPSPGGAVVLGDRGGVATLGRLGGRPPLTRWTSGVTVRTELRSSIVPEDDRHAVPAAGLAQPLGRCDPRSPRRATATPRHVDHWVSRHALRSSVVPEGDRHHPPPAADRLSHPVAILGRPAGRPPREPGVQVNRLRDVAIPSHPKGNRHSKPQRAWSRGWRSCDPRSPQRATATSAGPGTPARGSGCDPWSSRRATTASCSPARRSSPRSSCNPRPSRRTTATVEAPGGVAVHDEVAILGHPAGQPPPGRSGGVTRPPPGCDPRSSHRATATSGACWHGPSGRSCDPRSSRRATATSTARERLDRPQTRCDPRLPRRATATRASRSRR